MPVRTSTPSSGAAPSCLVLLLLVLLRVLIGVMASRAETCASVRHFDDRKAQVDFGDLDESCERQGGRGADGGEEQQEVREGFTTKAKKGKTRKKIK